MKVKVTVTWNVKTMLATFILTDTLKLISTIEKRAEFVGLNDLTSNVT